MAEIEKVNPEEFAKDFLSGQETSPEDIETGNPPGEVVEGETPTGDPPTTDPVEYDDYWSQVREEYKDAEIPQEISTGKDSSGKELTPQLRYQKFKEFILSQEKDSSSVSDDPFIQAYHEASKQAGFDRNTFFKEQAKMQDFTSLPDKDFLVEVYKQQRDRSKKEWKDEDIEKHIDSLNPIQQSQEADQYRNAMYNARLEEIRNTNARYTERLEKEDLPKITDSQKKLNDLFVEKYKNAKAIGGFTFEDQEREEFIKDIPSFTEKKIVKYDNGNVEILSQADQTLINLLASPESSMELLPYLYLVSKGKIKGFSSNLAEKAKDKAIEILDREPERQTGRASSEKFDENSFIQGR